MVNYLPTTYSTPTSSRPLGIDQSLIDSICNRVFELKQMNQNSQIGKSKIRKIMNNDMEGVAVLLGEKVAKSRVELPIANLILIGCTRLGQKLGKMPDIKVDPPVSTDTQSALDKAEKRARIVQSYDASCELDLKLPQVGRWLPGYSFVAFTIEHGIDQHGNPYPKLKIKDPYNTYPGSWGEDQQPADVAFCRMINSDRLAQLYPQYGHRIAEWKRKKSNVSGKGFGTAVDLSQISSHSWEEQSRGDMEIYEYINAWGTFVVAPEIKTLLVHNPNELKSGPPFRIAKRFSFDALVGHYDNAIGLMAAVARLNLLLMTSIEDNIDVETNIYGDIRGNEYKAGRNNYNFFTPGTKVERPQNNIPFQAFQQASRVEEQLRVMTGYSVTDDGDSPTSFITGRGVEQLRASVNTEIEEYQLVLKRTLEDLNYKQLEWEETYYPDREKTVSGVRKGAPYSEKYTPSAHIKGNYVVRREYGAMAAFDDNNKIIAGLQLLQAGIIDDDTMREQIAGLENHGKIKERINNNRYEQTLLSIMEQMAVSGDPRVMEAMVELLPQSDTKATLQTIFAPQEQPDQLSQDLPPQPGQPPPDSTTVLSALTGNGTKSGVQTVGRL